MLFDVDLCISGRLGFEVMSIRDDSSDEEYREICSREEMSDEDREYIYGRDEFTDEEEDEIRRSDFYD